MKLIIRLFLLSCLACAGTGCTGGIFDTTPASYKGMQKQSVAIMVWVDPAVRADFPRIQMDIASNIQGKLKEAAQKEEELKDITFPWEPRSVARFQVDHPETETQPVTEVAQRIGTSRMIYLEVENFSTRSEQSMQLYRGIVTASLKVVEVAAGKGTIAYQEDHFTVVFPPKGAPEGIPGVDPYKFYLATIEEFSKQVSRRFYTHYTNE